MFVICKRYTLSGLISTPTLEKTRRQSVKDTLSLMHVFARRVRAGLTAPCDSRSRPRRSTQMVRRGFVDLDGDDLFAATGGAA
jgi:hypothetical protein